MKPGILGREGSTEQLIRPLVGSGVEACQPVACPRLTQQASCPVWKMATSGVCADQACLLLLLLHAMMYSRPATHAQLPAEHLLGEQLPRACREAQKEVEILESKLQRVDKARASEASLRVWLLVLYVLSSNRSKRRQPEANAASLLVLACLHCSSFLACGLYLMTAQLRRAWQHTGCSLLSDGQQRSDHLPGKLTSCCCAQHNLGAWTPRSRN